jgi:hypothetical protein
VFILDSLMISGIQWALKTAITAAEAEMNDDGALREQLLEAEMRREIGELSDEEFGEIEAELLARIREIKERREGSGPLAMTGDPIESTEDGRFHVEASVSGDFHDPAAAPHTTIVETSPVEGQLVQTSGERTIEILPEPPARPVRARRAGRTGRPARSTRRSRTASTGPTSRGVRAAKKR